MIWKTLITFISVCFFPIGFLSADHCNIRQVQVVQQQAAVVATPIVVATFQPFAVAVPVYGVGYAQDNTDIINELRALRQEIQALRTMPQVERKEALQQLPKGLQVLQTRCSSCHDAINAKGKGGGMELFNAAGTFVDVGDNASKILEQINNDHMPKGKEKLTAQEKYDLLWYLTVKEVQKK